VKASGKPIRKDLQLGATAFDDEGWRRPKPRINPWRPRLDATMEKNGSVSGLVNIKPMAIALGSPNSHLTTA